MNRNVDDLFISPREWMDEESVGVVRLVRQWADKEIVSRRMEYRENYADLFMAKLRKLLIDIGLQKLCVPSDHGGFGWNTPGHAPGMLSLACEIGRADASAGVLFSALCSIFSLISMEHNYNRNICDTISSLSAGEDLSIPAVILPGSRSEERV